MKIAVLVSGGGTNLQALIDYEKKTENCPYQIELVIADTKKAYALERAASAGIKTKIVSPYAVMGAEKAKTADKQEKRLAVSDAALAAAKEAGCEALVLAGWLTVLSGKIIEEYLSKNQVDLEVNFNRQLVLTSKEIEHEIDYLTLILSDVLNDII